MPELLVQLDGQTVPLQCCRWVQFTADGCAIASLLGDCAVDADAAHREFTPRQRDRDRQTRQGHQVELLTRDQWKQRAEACLLGGCQHRGGASNVA